MTVESRAEGGVYYATGTWMLQDSLLSCDYVYPAAPQGYPVRQIATAIYDSVGGKLHSGVWKNIGAPSGTGKFEMSHVTK